MNILRAHHVAVICSDYRRSKQFYTEVLGLEVVAEVHRAERDSYKLDLRLPDGTQIELFSFPNPPKRASYPEACGLRHFAFEVAAIGEAVADSGGRVHRQAVHVFRRPGRAAAGTVRAVKGAGVE